MNVDRNPFTGMFSVGAFRIETVEAGDVVELPTGERCTIVEEKMLLYPPRAVMWLTKTQQTALLKSVAEHNSKNVDGKATRA